MNKVIPNLFYLKKLNIIPNFLAVGPSFDKMYLEATMELFSYENHCINYWRTIKIGAWTIRKKAIEAVSDVTPFSIEEEINGKKQAETFYQITLLLRNGISIDIKKRVKSAAEDIRRFIQLNAGV